MSHYDALGGRIYDAIYREEQYSKYEVILSRLRIEPTDLLLDVGCGTGLLLGKVRAFSVGVDFSILLLRRARRRIRRGGGLIQCDAMHLPLREGIFSKVLAVTVIQNIEGPERFLSEIKRVARPGSDIVITVLKKALGLEEFKQMLESSGLSIESIFEGEGVKDWIIFASNR